MAIVVRRSMETAREIVNLRYVSQSDLDDVDAALDLMVQAEGIDKNEAIALVVLGKSNFNKYLEIIRAEPKTAIFATTKKSFERIKAKN